MYIQSLQLRDFRNFEWLQLELRTRLNFFLGENGQGKTNLLEAAYLLCRGNSFRHADSASLIRRDSHRAKISGHFFRDNLDYHVEMLVETGKKSAAINGKRASSVNLMAHFPLVLFSPESLTAIKEGPDQRRQLIDEILINHDPTQGRVLREFTKALRSRNRLLKNISDGIGSRAHQLASLDSLTRIYLLLASHLTVARTRALRDLQPEIQNALGLIMGGATQEISVEYLVSGQPALQWSESQVFDALQKRALELASREQASGSSLVGPHKHDIKLLFAGNDSRFYASQGQQRALILALKIAQIVYHHGVHQTYPILLLDDVLSELDAQKRVNLMKFLESVSAQILITSTDLTWSDQFELDRNSIFQVSNGRIEVGTSGR